MRLAFLVKLCMIKVYFMPSVGAAACGKERLTMNAEIRQKYELWLQTLWRIPTSSGSFGTSKGRRTRSRTASTGSWSSARAACEVSSGPGGEPHEYLHRPQGDSGPGGLSEWPV